MFQVLHVGEAHGACDDVGKIEKNGEDQQFVGGVGELGPQTSVEKKKIRECDGECDRDDRVQSEEKTARDLEWSARDFDCGGDRNAQTAGL